MKRSMIVLGLIVAVMAGVMVVRGGRELRPDASAEMEREHALEGHPGARIAPDAVLAISPRVASMRPGVVAAVPKLTPAMQEYTLAKAYKPVYERLRASERRSPEETWILAKILDHCAKVADREDTGKPFTLGGEEAKARFVASLSPKDPQRDKRIAAFERMNADRCAGLRDVKATEKEIRDLLVQASSAGDPKAAADLVGNDLLAQLKDDRGRVRYEPGRFPVITDAQLDTLKRSVESGDPEALVAAVEALTLPMGNLSLRAGPDELPIDSQAMDGAARLAACDLGAPCGPDSRPLLDACAMQGRCDAASYREYLYFYAMSPETSQQATLYQASLVQAVKNRDWSYFTFVRGPGSRFAPYVTR